MGVVGGVPLPCQEIYLHRLLCWMYRGPPAGPSLEVCHMCEKKLCLAPWHLVWDTHQQNILGHFVHKKDRRRYHPYNLQQPPAGA